MRSGNARQGQCRGSGYSNSLPRNGFCHAHPLCIWGDTYLSNERGDERAHPCHAAAGAQAQSSGRRGVDLKQPPKWPH